jgi:hypothetical protein
MEVQDRVIDMTIYRSNWFKSKIMNQLRLCFLSDDILTH